MCNINHEMVAKVIFLNKKYTKSEASKLSCVVFYYTRSIFEVTVPSYVFAKKACQSETKIENKYHQCTINIFKLLSSFSDQYTG